MKPRTLLRISAGAAAVLAVFLLTMTGSSAWSQTAIKAVAPFRLGGGSAILTRLQTEHVGPAQRTTMVIENRPAAARVIGTEAVSWATRDGNTALMVADSTVSCIQLNIASKYDCAQTNSIGSVTPTRSPPTPAPTPIAQGVPTALINWATTYQTVYGFGGQTWKSANDVTDAQADMLFSTTSGIGLTIVRTANTPDGSIPDLVTLQKAVARGAKVELSLQSPPAYMKDSDSFYNGTLLTSQYAAYAAYIVNYLLNLQAHGASVDVVSVQNEPDAPESRLGACMWTAYQLETFIGDYLGPAFGANGITAKIMLGEGGAWFDNDFVSVTLNDPNAAQYVSIIAGHGYGSGIVDGTGVSYCCHTATAYPTEKQVWMSEVNGGQIQSTTGDTNMWVWDPTMNDALVWAHNIHDYFTVAGVSAWEYWELASHSSDNVVGYNDGLLDHNFNPGHRYYVVGNWSKFVRPGWVRIDTTTNLTNGVYVSAFKDSLSGNFAIVAINNNSSDISLDFALNGASSSSVTPWVTSASLNLAQQSAFFVGGSNFNYPLAAYSVTTFVGTGQ